MNNDDEECHVLKKLEVADMRKGYHAIREKWIHHSSQNPIMLSEKVPNGMTIAHFAFNAVLNNHNRRHDKSQIAQKERIKTTCQEDKISEITV